MLQTKQKDTRCHSLMFDDEKPYDGRLSRTVL